jgi:hypothetical protein
MSASVKLASSAFILLSNDIRSPHRFPYRSRSAYRSRPPIRYCPFLRAKDWEQVSWAAKRKQSTRPKIDNNKEYDYDYQRHLDHGIIPSASFTEF